MKEYIIIQDNKIAVAGDKTISLMVPTTTTTTTTTVAPTTTTTTTVAPTTTTTTTLPEFVATLFRDGSNYFNGDITDANVAQISGLIEVGWTMTFFYDSVQFGNTHTAGQSSNARWATTYSGEYKVVVEYLGSTLYSNSTSKAIVIV